MSAEAVIGDRVGRFLAGRWGLPVEGRRRLPLGDMPSTFSVLRPRNSASPSVVGAVELTRAGEAVADAGDGKAKAMGEALANVAGYRYSVEVSPPSTPNRSSSRAPRSSCPRADGGSSRPQPGKCDQRCHAGAGSVEQGRRRRRPCMPSAAGDIDAVANAGAALSTSREDEDAVPEQGVGDEDERGSLKETATA